MMTSKISLRALLFLFSAIFSTLALAADEKVVLETSEGNIVIELNTEKAPLSVANFLDYVDSGFYDGVIFHRVIKNFMIQGGGFSADMQRKETKDAIQNEAKNGLKNIRGSIAMARTSAPHSATAQFFINHVDNESLDYPSFDGWGYAVFGQVVEGMDVVDAIANTPTGFRNGLRDVPVKSVTILSAKRLTAEAETNSTTAAE